MRFAEWGALFIVVLVPLVFNPYSAQSFERPKVVFFQWAVATLAIAFVAGRGSLAPWSFVDAALLAYATSHLVATSESVDPARSFWGSFRQHGTFTLLCAVAFYFLLSRVVRSRAAQVRLLDWLLAASVPVALYGLVQYLEIDPLSWQTDSVSRVLSTMGRSNVLGAYLAILVPWTLFRMRTRPGRRGLLVVASLQVLVVLLSEARAAWLSLVAGAAVFRGLTGRGQPRRTIVILMLSVALLALLAPLSRIDLSFHREAPSRYGAESFAAARDQTIHSRFTIWRCTYAMIRERWGLGYGPGTFASVFGEQCPIVPLGHAVDDPHNIFLREMASAGLVGILGLCAVLGALFGAALRFQSLHEEERLLRAAIIGSGVAYLVQAQFNTEPATITIAFFTLLAIAHGHATREEPNR